MLPRRHAPPAPPRASATVILAAVAATLLAACGPSGEPDIRVVGDVQAAEPVAGASILVFELANDGDGDDALIGADTDAALGIELHETRIEDGRASMVQLEEVPLPAGETIRSRSGGLHLMMVVPDETVVDGATFDMTLQFERSEDLSVPVTVTDLLDLAESTFDDPETDQ